MIGRRQLAIGQKRGDTADLVKVFTGYAWHLKQLGSDHLANQRMGEANGANPAPFASKYERFPSRKRAKSEV